MMLMMLSEAPLMLNYDTEDDWKIELRRLKADNKFRVCTLNSGFRLTAGFVILSCLPLQSRVRV